MKNHDRSRGSDEKRHLEAPRLEAQRLEAQRLEAQRLGAQRLEAQRLEAHGVTLGYDGRIINDDLTLAVPDGSFTVIVGANGCGKSTLLRGLARLLKPSGGAVHLDGKDIHRYPSKEVARRLGLLPQAQVAPDGITVADLVSRGRYPHQTLLRQWSNDDEEAVHAALTATRTLELAGRLVDELSGGQRQRVWLAMALAQRTEILLLDEPTTYLDIAHQVEVLDLCDELRTEGGYTQVAVLHDLNLACRYATHLVAMKDGAIVAAGHPKTIVTPELVEHVYGLACRILTDPETGTPLVVPRKKQRKASELRADVLLEDSSADPSTSMKEEVR